MGFSGIHRSSARWSQSETFSSRHHSGLSECGLAVIGRVLQNVPNRLSRPDRFAGSSSFTGFLEPAANFAETAAVQSNPLEHLFHNSRLFGYGLEPRLTSTVVNTDVSISERRTRHDVQ